MNDINALAESPVLTALSFHVRRPNVEYCTVFNKGMFPAIEYFKFVSGVILLEFLEGTMPNLRTLKLGFNAHKWEKYRNMLVGIEHLLNLQKIVASIGAAPNAEESERRSAESAFKEAIRKHPCHRSFKQVKTVDRIDENYDCSKKLNWSQQEESSNERGELTTWKLAFRTQPQLSIYTGSKIEDEAGKPLEIVLVDADTGTLTTLPQALRVEVVPLSGDFPPDGHKDWAPEDFQKAIMKEREGKRSLLTGEVGLTMWKGRATLGELQFTDNSSWVRCRKFRIGVRVVPSSYDGARIQEAMTEAFVVRDHRGELYRKHYPPVLGDDVWRLEKIGKEGAFHRKLRNNHVVTVQEFVRMLMVKPDELRAILGEGMTDRMWNVTTHHAKTCVLDDKVYAYAALRGIIYVNSVFRVLRVEIGGEEWPLQQLSTTQTMIVEQLMLEAYEHRHSLQEVDAVATNYIPLQRDALYIVPYHANIPLQRVNVLADGVYEVEEELDAEQQEGSGFHIEAEQDPDQSSGEPKASEGWIGDRQFFSNGLTFPMHLSEGWSLEPETP